MPEKREVVIPTGFIAVLIEIENTVKPHRLALVPSNVALFSGKGALINVIPVRIGLQQVITVRPGKYMVTGTLGQLESKQVSIEVKPGQTEEIVFHFGKGPQ